jgi:hypothetical protein
MDIRKKTTNFLNIYFEVTNIYVYLHSLKKGKQISAGVVKLVDTPDLGSGASRCEGSSPFTRTNIKP